MQKHTKKALVLSVLSLILCVSMLVGTTFAWFTDSVTTGINTIQSGTLDVDMVKPDGSAIGEKLYFRDVNGNTNILWEPGAKFALDAFKIVNKGNLALKYQVLINGLEGDATLLEVIDFTVKVGNNAEIPLAEFNALYGEGLDNYLLANSETESITLYGKMREEANNDYQNKTIEGISITVYATQYTYENDSFDNQYDADAPVVTYKVNPSNAQDYLDGKYGSTTNMKLVLEAGDYGVLYLGRPTKYAGSSTTYICSDGNTHSKTVFETTDAEEFKAHLADNKWHTTPKYITTLEDLVIVGENGANVAGLFFSTGHSYGDVYDYVRDHDSDAGSVYYSTAYVSNVTIENVAFTGKLDINTSDADTVVDGITFRNCSFTTGGTASANGAAIRYYNEANNGNLKNLTVENCKFTNCYQGIYTHHVNGISVIGNTFDTLGHNAIALQGHDGTVDHKAVVITNNVMKNVNDRVIRFNEVGAGTQITIQYNAAVNSGNSSNEVIRATSIAAGATFDVKYNDWGGKIVANDQLKDEANKAATYAADNSGLSTAITSGADTVILDSGNYIIPAAAKGKTLTIVGTGDTGVAVTKVGSGGENCDYGLDGSTVTFENVTITTNSSTYIGYARCKGTYNNCTFNGTYTLYGDSVFNNCTFNVSGDVYNLWTWGAPNAIFNGCTFNNDGKALLLYGTANTKLTVNDCVFNDNGGLEDLKAAIEIGNDYGKSYELIVNNTVVNGYEINDKGISTGTTLWGNKNSMGTDKLNVVVDGVDVY